MAAEPDLTPSETALAEAIQGVTASTQALVRDEIELAKLEVAQKARTFGHGAAIGAAAGIFLIGAGLLALQGSAWLAWYLLFPDEQFYLGFFLVALLLVVMAVIAGLLASKLLKKAQAPVPEGALDQLRETQELVSEEATMMKDQVREVVTKPEDERL